MAQTITCSACGRRLLLPDGLEGRTFGCPSCHAEFQTENATAVAVIAVPPPAPPRVDEEPLWVLPATEYPGLAGAPILDVLPADPLVSGPQPQPPNLPKRRSRAVTAVVGLVGLLALIAIVSSGYLAKPRSVRVSESPSDRQESVPNVFNRELASREETAVALIVLFDGFGQALRAQDGDRLLSYYDVDRTLDEFAAQGLPGARRGDRREAARRAVEAGLRSGLVQNEPLARWTTTEIRSVKPLADDELLVIARHRDGGAVRLKMRWWLKRTGGAWRIYDYEDLDMGMRASASLGMLARLQGRDALQVAIDVMRLQAAQRAVALRWDADTAEQNLKAIKGTNLPRPFEALRHMVTASIHNLRGEYAQALDAIAVARRLRPDIPILDLLAGTVYNQMHQPNEALAHLHKYQELLGDDSNLWVQLGWASQELGRFAEAREHYRKALDDNPAEADALRFLILASGEEDPRDDLGPRFMRLGNHLNNFDAVVEACSRQRDGASLEAISLAMLQLHPKHAPAAFNLARARLWRGRLTEALPLLWGALAKCPQRDRKKFVVTFAKGLAETDKVPDGQYEEALQIMEKEGGAKRSLSEAALIEGVLCVRASKWDRAVARLKNCRVELAGERVLRFQFALSLHFLRRYAEAAAEYRAILDQEPDYFDALRNLVGALPPDDSRDDLGRRFAELRQPQAHFDELVAECHEQRDPKALAAIARQMQELDEKCAAADVQLGVCAAWQGRADEAALHLNAAVEKEPGKRKLFYRDLATALVEAGKTAECYPKMGHAREGFAALATGLVGHGRWVELRRLVGLHAAGHPDDPMLPFCRGALHLQDGAYAKADKEFTAGLTRRPEPSALAPFRESLVIARYRSGQALAAYGDIGPAEETFRQLAALAFYEREDALMEKLLALHERKYPDSRDLHSYRVRLKARQGDAAAAVALFRTALEKVPAEDHDDLTGDFLEEMARAGHAVAAYRAGPDRLVAFRRLAEEILEADRRADLPSLYDAHRQGHPADPWLSYYRGLESVQDEAWTEAARLLREAMKNGPGEMRERARWSYVLATYRSGKGLDAYREANEAARKDVFAQVSGLMMGDRKGKELHELVELYRPDAAAQGEVLFVEACARALQGKPAEAVALARQATEKGIPDAHRAERVRHFVLAMKQSGHLLEGYRAAPDHRYAFEVLAQKLVEEKNPKDLAALLRAHGPGSASAEYQGELHLLEGKPKDAERVLAAALSKAIPAERHRLRSALFRARVRLGKAAETYREFGPEWFDTLASWCFEEKDAAGLASLVALRRQERADDPDLFIQEIEICWLRQDYGTAWKLLSPYANKQPVQRHRWKVNDYLVRCLIRLGRFPEAVDQAKRIADGPDESPILLVLAHAASGNVQEVIAVAARGNRRWLIRACYDDRDLGPILRSVRFKPFRQKFPEPERDHDLP